MSQILDFRAPSFEEPKRIFPPPPPGVPSFKPKKTPMASPSTTSPYIAQKVLQYEPNRVQQFNPNGQVQRYQSARTLDTTSRTSIGNVNMAAEEPFYSDMYSFSSSDKLDKSEFSPDQLQTFSCMFRAANVNSLGMLSFLEFRSLLVEFGLGHLTNVMIKEILDGIDSDGSKMVTFGEFVRMWDRAANRDLTLPFTDDLYEALKRADMLPMKVAPVPFSKAKTFFETKTNQMTMESLLERQQLLMRRNRQDVVSRVPTYAPLQATSGNTAASSVYNYPRMNESVPNVRPQSYY